MISSGYYIFGGNALHKYATTFALDILFNGLKMVNDIGYGKGFFKGFSTNFTL